tara:strand:- start:774 stop:1424 length:651 start_codon:yes stop_codon:yes gene_type:complete
MTGGITFARKNSKGEGYKDQLDVAIMGAGLNPSIINTTNVPEGIMLKPNRWLGKEIWTKLNINFRELGASWIYGKNIWMLPYYREPQAKWHFIRTYQSRRRMISVTKRLSVKTHSSLSKVRNEILPLLSYMIRINEAMYKDLSTWILKSPNDKLKNLKHMSFKKKAKDFVSLENYSKYKQREMKKMRNNITKETETDIKNIKRWLSNEKKNAKWKK